METCPSNDQPLLEMLAPNVWKWQREVLNLATLLGVVEENFLCSCWRLGRITQVVPWSCASNRSAHNEWNIYQASVIARKKIMSEAMSIIKFSS